MDIKEKSLLISPQKKLPISEDKEVSDNPQIENSHQEKKLEGKLLSSFERDILLKKIDDVGDYRASNRLAIQYLRDQKDNLVSVLNTYKKELIEILRIAPKETLPVLFDTLKENNFSEADLSSIVLFSTELAGAEQARDVINDFLHRERQGENTNQYIVDNFERARALITPNHEKIAIEKVEELYQDKIKFEAYGVNEKMQPKEVKLLKELIPKDKKVLDIGCGTGRLILALQKDGYDITGYDFTPRHPEVVKEDAKKIGLDKPKVFRGDWRNSALHEKTFDVAYSLGRNILHEYSLPDQVQMFREAHRILKNGGKFIFDIPNRDIKSSEYRRRVLDYAETMQDFGVKNFRYGAIYDSPDGKHFSTRYVFSRKDIEEICQETCFKIIEIRKNELETGKGDKNLYFVLEKVREEDFRPVRYAIKNEIDLDKLDLSQIPNDRKKLVRTIQKISKDLYKMRDKLNERTIPIEEKKNKITKSIFETRDELQLVEKRKDWENLWEKVEKIKGLQSKIRNLQLEEKEADWKIRQLKNKANLIESQIARDAIFMEEYFIKNKMGQFQIQSAKTKLLGSYLKSKDWLLGK